MATAPARHQQHGVAVVGASAEVQHVHGVRLDDEVRQVGTDEAVAQVVSTGDRLAQFRQQRAGFHMHDEEFHARVRAIDLKPHTAVKIGRT